MAEGHWLLLQACFRPQEPWFHLTGTMTPGQTIPGQHSSLGRQRCTRPSLTGSRPGSFLQTGCRFGSGTLPGLGPAWDHTPSLADAMQAWNLIWHGALAQVGDACHWPCKGKLCEAWLLPSICTSSSGMANVSEMHVLSWLVPGASCLAMSVV